MSTAKLNLGFFRNIVFLLAFAALVLPFVIGGGGEGTGTTTQPRTRVKVEPKPELKPDMKPVTPRNRPINPTPRPPVMRGADTGEGPEGADDFGPKYWGKGDPKFLELIEPAYNCAIGNIYSGSSAADCKDCYDKLIDAFNHKVGWFSANGGDTGAFLTLWCKFLERLISHAEAEESPDNGCSGWLLTAYMQTCSGGNAGGGSNMN